MKVDIDLLKQLSCTFYLLSQLCVNSCGSTDLVKSMSEYVDI